MLFDEINVIAKSEESWSFDGKRQVWQLFFESLVSRRSMFLVFYISSPSASCNTTCSHARLDAEGVNWDGHWLTYAVIVLERAAGENDISSID